MDHKIAQDLQTLERERFTLLARLEACPEGPSDVKSLRECLIREYNEVTHEYNEALEASRTHSPDQLPTELWIKIIKEVLSSQWDWPFKLLLPLTLVSWRWATVIVKTPSLWTSVRLPGTAEDFDAMLAVHLTLSNPLTLFLQLGYDVAIIERAAPFLIPHAHRIEGLDLYSFDVPLSNSFLSKTSFPALRSVHLYGADIVAMARFLALHLAIELPFVVDNNGADHVFSECWAAEDKKLTQSSLPISDTTLQRVDFMASIEYFTALGGDNTHIDDSDIILAPPTSQLGFRNLTFKHVPWRLMKNILGRCGIQLTTITATMSLTKLYAFFEKLDALPGLTYLRISTTRDERELIRDKKIQETNVHTSLVSFDWTFKTHYGSSATIDITSYLAWLVEKAPKLRFVCVSGSGLEIIDPTILGRLDTLTLLDLQDVKCIENSGKGIITMPRHLRKLSIPADAVMLSTLRSSSTSILSVRLTSGVQSEMATGMPLLIEGEHWSAVIDLTIWCAPWEFRMILGNIQLAKLRSVSVTSLSFVANLCRNLAIRPDDLPVLEELHMSIVTEWDIFLIMLERRLIARSRGISALRKISIKDIPRYLRSIVIANLQGSLVERPSNYDLSLQANCQTILDPSISGCMECHLHHLYCAEPVRNTNQERLASLLGTYNSPSEYPKTETELLATWESRFRQMWPNIILDEEYQPMRTRACNKYDLVELTRDSIIEDALHSYLFQAA